MDHAQHKAKYFTNSYIISNFTLGEKKTRIEIY